MATKASEEYEAMDDRELLASYQRLSARIEDQFTGIIRTLSAQPRARAEVLELQVTVTEQAIVLMIAKDKLRSRHIELLEEYIGTLSRLLDK